MEQNEFYQKCQQVSNALSGLGCQNHGWSVDDNTIAFKLVGDPKTYFVHNSKTHGPAWTNHVQLNKSIKEFNTFLEVVE